MTKHYTHTDPKPGAHQAEAHADPVYIAHVRKPDHQTVSEHLLGVGAKTKALANKLGLAQVGELTGLLHDFGKFSSIFQNYIRSATALINPDIDDDWVDAKEKKGKIDHSTAGAQWVYETLKNLSGDDTLCVKKEFCAQLIALCIASHHSGLIDCINADGKNIFKKRMRKADEDTHLQECKHAADKAVVDAALALCNAALLDQLWAVVDRILTKEDDSKRVQNFALGLLTRYLFSCLIDADRSDSADFESPKKALLRSQSTPHWTQAIERLEQHLLEMEQRSEALHSAIDPIRRDISRKCHKRAYEQQGIYTLSVPTGGGKTLAGLRYALHHARVHQLDRIIFVIPYTSIIEQNAQAVREIVETDSDARQWVLEHHSNLEPDQQTWQNKLFTENWDRPIVFTTMVQFLETCFAGGTQSARRFHQLGKSVLVFDEVQTLPIQCVYMFCNTLNFLVDHAQTTAVLCTATQPVLDRVPDPENGQLRLRENHELVGDKQVLLQLFVDLDRVEIVNKCEPQGWNCEQMRDFVHQLFRDTASVLVIVNTKNWAKNIHLACRKAGVDADALFHLSTNQCAAHRKVLLDGPHGIKSRLQQGKPVLCISTQLIEAGVDVSFANVVRFLAGLDSMAQAGGRCNRHGERKDSNGQAIKGVLYIVKPDHEDTDLLHEIEEGKKCALRVFNEMQEAYLPNKAVSPDVLQHYFEYFFYLRREAMCYPLKDGTYRHLLALLSDNESGKGGNGGCAKRESSGLLLRQSFMEAGRAFKAIDAPTKAVIVPYQKGVELIAELCGSDPKLPRFYEVLRQAQKFSVNVFPHVWAQLEKTGAIRPIQDTGLYFLVEQHYDPAFGLSVEPVLEGGEMHGGGGVF